MQPRIVIESSSGQPLVTQLQAILQRARRYRVDLAQGPLPDGIASMEPRPDLIIPILPASKERIAQLLALLHAKEARPRVLPVIRPDDLNPQLDNLFHGTTDFLVTPLREVEVLARVRRLLSGIREPARAMVQERPTEPVGLAHLVSEDPAFLAVKRKIPLVARCEVPVLLTGETGTGKELCARAIHGLSPRAGRTFLPVNCGAIPTELFERELFGHAKGAFTGAWAAQPGILAEAEGGTLFLDEVGTLSLAAQVKLLRFLEDHTYHALGSPSARRADVRILAATNAALPEKVREGTFRGDLFHRLAVLTLTLPPLRERPADIPLLVAHFTARYANQVGGQQRQFSPRALEALCRYPWPGNVRELANVTRQVIVLTDVPTIEPEDLPIPLLPSTKDFRAASLKQAKALIIAQFEQAYLCELLRTHHGNVTQAARAAQKERRAFGRLLKKYNLAKPHQL